MLTPIRLLSDGPIRVELARWRVVEQKKDGTDEKTLNEYIVVTKKLMVGSEENRLRLQREAEVIAKLHHKNIVPLLAIEEETLIYAYAEGIPLSEYLQDNPLSIDEALRISCDVLEALVYAHANGIIHCDVKPSNIIIESDESHPHQRYALLNDFGFAKDIALASITAQGMRLGTPNYMAPEQFAGTRDDPRSDIYAVGATLYHMLSGSPPYGEDVIPFLLGRPSILKPLPWEAVHLHEMVLRALASEPSERFQDARAMLEALRTL